MEITGKKQKKKKRKGSKEKEKQREGKKKKKEKTEMGKKEKKSGKRTGETGKTRNRNIFGKKTRKLRKEKIIRKVMLWKETEMEEQKNKGNNKQLKKKTRGKRR